MRLKDLQSSLEEYLGFLHSPSRDAHLPLWEAQRLFQERWNPDAPDWADMYEKSLDSTQTRRYWSRDDYQPKALMHRFMQQQPIFTRQLFDDLFREDRSIDGRLRRFVLACDELLKDHQERHPRERQASHYHDDGYQIIFLYLAFRFPDLYSPYDYTAFEHTLRRIGAPDVPATHDPERFVKVSRTIFKFLQQHEGIQAAHRARLDPNRDYMAPSMLLVYDYMQFIKGEKLR